MDVDTAQSKKRKATHITIVTDPTKLVQPYQYTSHSYDEQEIDSVQRNNKPCTAAGQHSNTSSQSHAPLKPASYRVLLR